MASSRMKKVRRDMQIVFQDPYASLNPRMTVGEIVGEGPLVHGLTDKAQARGRSSASCSARSASTRATSTATRTSSRGGQRQRIGIARALALNPDFIVCDEPVSALDVSIQSQVLNLLDDLQKEFGLTYLFIAHNLAVVEHISDRVGVMYLGKIVEMADVDELYANPRHPYTVALLSAVPNPTRGIKKKRLVLKGDIPSPAAPPSGCRFHTRCWLRERLGNPERCETEEPVFRDFGAGPPGGLPLRRGDEHRRRRGQGRHRAGHQRAGAAAIPSGQRAGHRPIRRRSPRPDPRRGRAGRRAPDRPRRASAPDAVDLDGPGRARRVDLGQRVGVLGHVAR